MTAIQHIRISRDGEEYGPFDYQQAAELIIKGNLVASDLAWYEGLPGWMPLGSVAAFESTFATTSPAVAAPLTPTAQTTSPLRLADRGHQPSRGSLVASSGPRETSEPYGERPVALASIGTVGFLGGFRRLLDGISGILRVLLLAPLGALLVWGSVRQLTNGKLSFFTLFIGGAGLAVIWYALFGRNGFSGPRGSGHNDHYGADDSDFGWFSNARDDDGDGDGGD